MNQFDASAQFRSCQKLLSAVVALAIQDSQLEPISRGRMNGQKEPTDFALSALRFLFTSDSDGYLVALDMNPGQFRKRLVNTMYQEKKNIGENLYKNKRAFKFNYQFFYKYYTKINFDLISHEKATE